MHFAFLPFTYIFNIIIKMVCSYTMKMIVNKITCITFIFLFIYQFSFPMHMVIYKLTLIGISIKQFNNSKTFYIILEKITLIFQIILKHQFTFSVSHPFLIISLVSIFSFMTFYLPNFDTPSLLFSIDPISLIDFINLFIFSLTIKFIIFKLTHISIPINKNQYSITLSFSLKKITFIYRFIGICQDPFSMGLTFQPRTFVDVSILQFYFIKNFRLVSVQY